ncbi:hypothetical protein FS749_006135 [Ceratobasidium sp. UAMH 11750]|nr:hypothetical protein FS749_006135 [Ceratobasidium sp. UAMH 11750]
MFGRYLLLPSCLKNNLPNTLDTAPPVDLTARRYLFGIIPIGPAQRNALRRLETSRLLEDYYPDWRKTLLFLQREKNIYRKGSYLYNISAESEAAWMGLGDGLGFSEHVKDNGMRLQRRCLNTRCPDPDDARFEGRGGERYCSTRCQVSNYMRTG